ncbi:MAG: PaaI family thioesterase [Candidatus Dormibacteria bacterium]
MSLDLDESWLNDRSEFQRNFVHGLRNPIGLHLQYHVEGERAVTEWTPSEEHVGFPGLAHGGLAAAVLDDAMGRCTAMLHRWVVTARQTVRFRTGAPIGTALRVEGWMTRVQRRVITTQGRILLPDGGIVADSEATFLPIPEPALQEMLRNWPGFADYIE